MWIHWTSGGEKTLLIPRWSYIVLKERKTLSGAIFCDGDITLNITDGVAGAWLVKPEAYYWDEGFSSNYYNRDTGWKSTAFHAFMEDTPEEKPEPEFIEIDKYNPLNEETHYEDCLN